MSVWQWFVDLGWSTFIPTTIGTVIGALVGGGIGLYSIVHQFRLQRQKEYANGVDDAVVQVLQATVAYVTDIHRYLAERDDRIRVPALVTQGLTSVRKPNPFALSVALDIAELRTRGDDQDVIHDALHAYRSITSQEKPETQLGGLGVLSTSLGEWRAGRRTHQEVRTKLSRI